ncbi:MAG: 3'-5' exonuclease, partial [Usitatibacteraceae bacterium]
LVGDPMQSIYRFREAEVSLFSRARQFGVGSVNLSPLTLHVNFRSSPGVVDWVNATFNTLMPLSEDAVVGAVPYSPCVAFGAGETDMGEEAVSLHPTLLRKDDDEGEDERELTPVFSADAEEARRVVNIIETTRQNHPEASIAVLVRNRGHLREIVPALKTAGIAFRAIDIDPLNARPVVRDLLSLTRAISHHADRIAWLAILRAPWCGLTLNDLAMLTHGAHAVDGVIQPASLTVWELLNDPVSLASLSADGSERAKKLREALAPEVAARCRVPLRDAVENAWLRLCGPAGLLRESDLDDAAQLFALLDDETSAQGSGGQLADLSALEQRVEKLFAGSVEADSSARSPPVQIMTIHKAKGLEFDTVIVPGLHRPPRRDDKKLLVWTEHVDLHTGESELLLAPIREVGAEDDLDADSIYRYVLQQDRDKQRQEIVRLLYVAATRAERRLHLLGTFTVRREEDSGEDEARDSFSPPRADSLLAALWPTLPEALVEQAIADRPPLRDAQTMPSGGKAQVPMRIASDQPLPRMPPCLSFGGVLEHRASEVDIAAIDFDWASETARHVGTVVHLLLQRIAEDGIEKWGRARVESAKPAIRRELAQRGVPTAELHDAELRVIDALTNTMGDSRGRWTLQAHDQARAVWRLTALQDGVVMNVAIDRTFVDAQNVRWIIDFKTGMHEGADVEAFLNNEQKRYAGQLETYARILRAMDVAPVSAPIRLGLYFPLLKGWREWESMPSPERHG